MDAAFNHAGASAVESFHEYTEEAYDHLLDVNLKGVFLAMLAEIKATLADGGAIVNTSSVGSLIGNHGLAPYIAASMV
ncbi:SDR family NAD(P)-dependent oxidoreductase [Streptomyces sp. H27-C3]|uniref:SDR family NAD(P)-dependent oxidoreductase n=1 Tax=Streptomyces sp. H27-C3 TaxID=3046305 RepID=UPI0024BA052E|nr:SDR family NAD(P)-dependent oxidoreductase [Streptomyces sp. H27-C3]MDJ0467054.1 SDR family NAD(P)-dependent oxidoreductase [Streptomyces sp. H27-C3]